jgi:hypothetical protein
MNYTLSQVLTRIEEGQHLTLPMLQQHGVNLLHAVKGMMIDPVFLSDDSYGYTGIICPQEEASEAVDAYIESRYSDTDPDTKDYTRELMLFQWHKLENLIIKLNEIEQL